MNNFINFNTPLETHIIAGKEVCVKREDLCINEPYAPPFSKIRGLWNELKYLRVRNVQTIGYVETSISMAGWGVACLAPKLGLKAVIFDPQYIPWDKAQSCQNRQIPAKPLPFRVLEKHREMWRQFGAEIIPLPAGRAKVNYYAARKHIKDFPNMVLLPLGLPLRETGKETAAVAEKLARINYFGTVVVAVGSGTIAAGVLSGFRDKVTRIIGVMCRTGDVNRKKQAIASYSRDVIIQEPGGLLPGVDFRLVNPGYAYTTAAEADCPFPCNRFYDLKAWKWLCDNIEDLEEPILFWNIGGEVEI